MGQPDQSTGKIGRKPFFLLHMLFIVYSLSGACSKAAAGHPFFSAGFCMYYAAEILLLGLYAAGWQQAIKRTALSAAFAGRAVTVIWGMAWGVLFFGEPVTAGKAAGAVLVMAGVAVYAGGEGDEG